MAFSLVVAVFIHFFRLAHERRDDWLRLSNCPHRDRRRRQAQYQGRNLA